MKSDLCIVVAILVGVPLQAFAQKNAETSSAPAATRRLPDEGRLPDFHGATTWINSPPLTAASLRGKVVLVDFLTYTCINWLRSYPYVRAWADKYRDQGLVVVGVQTPEFSFEKNVANVRWAARALNVDIPIVVDNDYAIWRAFSNRYWPAIYIADARGRIRHHQFGEGGYAETERVIQQLLSEKSSGIARDLVMVNPSGLEAAADWSNLRSPETYLGFERAQNFGSTQRMTANKRRVYQAPAELRLNQWALTGDWTVGREASRVNERGGRIRFRFHARDVHLVMGPATSGTAIRFRVIIDGHSPGTAHGSDVDEHGIGTVDQQRLYQLVRQTGTVRDRLFEIEFLEGAVECFCFTFG